MKVIFRFSLFALLFAGLCPISCIKNNACPPSSDYKLDIDDFSIQYANSLKRIPQGFSTKKNEKLGFYLNFSGKPITVEGPSISIPSFSFGQTAMATEPCPPDAFLSYSDSLSNFDLTCTNSYLGVASGTSLSQKFLVSLGTSYSKHRIENLSMAAFNDSLQHMSDDFIFLIYHYGIHLLSTDSVPAGEYQFDFSIQSNDGNPIKTRSDILVFE